MRHKTITETNPAQEETKEEIVQNTHGSIFSAAEEWADLSTKEVRKHTTTVYAVWSVVINVIKSIVIEDWMEKEKRKMRHVLIRTNDQDMTLLAVLMFWEIFKGLWFKFALKTCNSSFDQSLKRQTVFSLKSNLFSHHPLLHSK